MIKLSYSSLEMLHSHPHTWLLKQMGIPQPENDFFEEGKICHRIIQDHVARIKTDDRLKHILIQFPVVEVEDFDKKCYFEFPMGDYLIRGYYDGLDIENGRFLEIKSGSSWSFSKYQKSFQRKLYALSNLAFKEAYLILCARSPQEWTKDLPKTFKLPLTDQDREEAKQWVLDGIKILESGDLKADLVDGKCVDRFCFWGANCSFK